MAGFQDLFIEFGLELIVSGGYDFIALAQTVQDLGAEFDRGLRRGLRVIVRIAVVVLGRAVDDQGNGLVPVRVGGRLDQTAQRQRSEWRAARRLRFLGEIGQNLAAAVALAEE